MALLTRGPGARKSRRRGLEPGPSVREVCLLGTAREDAPWSEGARVEWGGRTYRVEATQPLSDDPPARYVHLTAEARAGDGN